MWVGSLICTKTETDMLFGETYANLLKGDKPSRTQDNSSRRRKMFRRIQSLQADIVQQSVDTVT